MCWLNSTADQSCCPDNQTKAEPQDNARFRHVTRASFSHSEISLRNDSFLVCVLHCINKTALPPLIHRARSVPWAGKPATFRLSPGSLYPTSHYHVGQNQWAGLTDGLLLILAFIQIHWPALLFSFRTTSQPDFRKSVADMTWSSTVDLMTAFHVRERKTVRAGVILNRCNEELYALLTVNSRWFNQIANRETAINEKWKYDLHMVLSHFSTAVSDLFGVIRIVMTNTVNACRFIKY